MRATKSALHIAYTKTNVILKSERMVMSDLFKIPFAFGMSVVHCFDC
jgi:hypothetical protein